jgi:hypothetical protein
MVRVGRSEKSPIPEVADGKSRGRKFSCLAKWLLTKKKMINRNVTSIMGVKLIATRPVPR